MKIEFQDFTEEQKARTLTLNVRDDKTFFLSLENYNLYGDKNENYCFFEMEKKQLKDFIGILLHIQSKMNK